MFYDTKHSVSPPGAIAIGGGLYGLGIGAIHFAGLRCTGEEENFFNCTVRFTIFSFFCSHFDDVGVLCPRELIKLITTPIGGSF